MEVTGKVALIKGKRIKSISQKWFEKEILEILID